MRDVHTHFYLMGMVASFIGNKIEPFFRQSSLHFFEKTGIYQVWIAFQDHIFKVIDGLAAVRSEDCSTVSPGMQ